MKVHIVSSAAQLRSFIDMYAPTLNLMGRQSGVPEPEGVIVLPGSAQFVADRLGCSQAGGETSDVDPADFEPDEIALEDVLSSDELKAICEMRGVAKSGTKAEMAERIMSGETGASDND